MLSTPVYKLPIYKHSPQVLNKTCDFLFIDNEKNIQHSKYVIFYYFENFYLFPEMI